MGDADDGQDFHDDPLTPAEAEADSKGLLTGSLAMLAGGVTALGGAEGAAVLAAGALPLLEEHFRWHFKRQMQKRGRCLGVASRLTGKTDEEVVESMTATETRALLLSEALDAAAATSMESKIRALGQSLASGVLTTDKATVDLERLWVRIWADIEAPHLRLLDYIASHGGVEESDDQIAAGPTGREAANLIVPVLLRHGLVVETAGATGASDRPGAWRRWRVREAGDTFLDRARQAGSLPDTGL